MKANIVICENRGEEMVRDLTALWEQSVKATHFFLEEGDIQGLKKQAEEAIRKVKDLLYVRDGRQIVGFMGIEGNKLEMLFVHPRYLGKGWGRQLVEYAIRRRGIKLVDVNEQNPQAVGFYKHLGFRCVSRSEKDGQGNPFPLLHLEL